MKGEGVPKDLERERARASRAKGMASRANVRREARPTMTSLATAAGTMAAASRGTGMSAGDGSGVGTSSASA